MANPEHVPELDGFDRMTVGLYRVGVVVAALGLLALVVELGAEAAGQPCQAWPAQGLVLIGTAMAMADLHLYDKRVRWVTVSAGWTGATSWGLGIAVGGVAGHWVAHAGLGFLFVSLSALALKERFCFRLPGLRAVPLFLAASLIPMVAGFPGPAALVLAPAAVLYVVLAFAKLRMPLHFDVGDKSRYQV